MKERPDRALPDRLPSPVLGGVVAALVVHGGLTVTSWTEHGYSGFFPPFAASNTTQIFSDLTLALTLVNLWVFHDLAGHPRRALVWGLHVLATLLAGSFAPLGYLLLRGRLQGERPDTQAAEQPR